MEAILAITKALADENRIRALMMLRHGELCVCQIIEMLGLAPSTVSKHMSILRQTHLVDGHKDGRWMYYCLPGRNASQAVKQALKLLADNLETSLQTQKDDEKLLKVLQTTKESLCKKQMGK
jgi:DNA-binding transcriptional ArsR family regulator